MDRDPPGYFYILDRLKDMIVTGGENVYCGEVEAVILDHPAVREVAVFGIPDAKWGELVAACVVLKPGLVVTGEELIGPLSSEPGELQGSSPRGVL
jgi:acyl-CoA synthetase (AMP-forming)/AMP-acid ligase II